MGIYKGNSGIEITIAVSAQVNLSDATVKKILVQKPGSSVLVEWTDGITAPTATTLRYVTQRYDLCDPDQVPLAGDYLIQAYAEWANGAVHHGDIFVLPVLEPLPRVS